MSEIKIYTKKNATTDLIVKLCLVCLGNEKKFVSLDLVKKIEDLDINKKPSFNNYWEIKVENNIRNIEKNIITKIYLKDVLNNKHDCIVLKNLDDEELLVTGEYHKMLYCNNTDIWHALGKKIVDFFGGIVLTDNDELIYKNTKPKYDVHINSNIREKKFKFNELLRDEQPLTYEDKIKAQQKSLYKSIEKEWFFLKKNDFNNLNKELNSINSINKVISKKIKI